MNKTDFLLDHFYRSTHIPIHFLTEDGKMTLLLYGYTAQQSPLQCDHMLGERLIRTQRTNEPRLDFELDVVCCALFQDTLGHWVVLGPSCIFSDTETVSLQYARAHGLSESFHLPASDLASFSAATALLYFQLTGRMISETALALIHPDETANHPMEANSVQQYMMERTELERHRFTYREELAKMQPIIDGDVEAIRRSITPEAIHNSLKEIGQLAQLPLKQIEYTVVVSIALATRAAIQGGMPPATAYAISDTLLQQLSCCTDLPEMLRLQGEVRLTFAAGVRDIQLQSSRLSCVESAKNFMRQHLNKPFTLEELAHYVGTNPSYLCRRFKQTEGVTITQYMQTLRINAAKNMLRYSNQSIAEISSWLCFHSQSRFGQIFRQITGMTPGEYRNRV